MADLTPQAARDIVVQAWTAVHGRPPTTGEAAYTQAIAFFENQYGRAAGQFARYIASGAGYNWGSLETQRSSDGSCRPGTVPGVDASNPRCFYVYPDDLSAAKAFVHSFTVAFPARAAAILSALNGSPSDVAAAMRVSPAYYEGAKNTTEAQKVSAYASGISGALSSMRSANIPTPSVKQAGSGLLLLAALGAAGYVYWKRPDLVRKIPYVGRKIA